MSLPRCLEMVLRLLGPSSQPLALCSRATTWEWNLRWPLMSSCFNKKDFYKNPGGSLAISPSPLVLCGRHWSLTTTSAFF